MRDAHAGAEYRRLVGAEDFDQKARHGIDADHQREQFAVAAAEWFAGQKQEANYERVDGAIDLRGMHGQASLRDIRCLQGHGRALGGLNRQWPFSEKVFSQEFVCLACRGDFGAVDSLQFVALFKTGAVGGGIRPNREHDWRCIGIAA